MKKKEFSFPMTIMAAVTIIILASATFLILSYFADFAGRAYDCRLISLGCLIASVIFATSVSIYFIFDDERRKNYFFMLSSSVRSVLTWILIIALLPLLIVFVPFLMIYCKLRLKKINQKKNKSPKQ